MGARRRGKLRGLQKVVAAWAVVLRGHVHCESCGLISIGVHLILKAAVQAIQALKVYQGHLHGCGSASAKPWDPRIRQSHTQMDRWQAQSPESAADYQGSQSSAAATVTGQIESLLYSLFSLTPVKKERETESVCFCQWLRVCFELIVIR